VKLPTASSLHRALACPASAVLPRAPSTTSEAAERGTAIHDWIAHELLGRPKPPPAEYRETCEGINIPAILGGRLALWVEASYAYNVRTGQVRYLGSMLGRGYALHPDELAGTADMILREGDETPRGLCVGDIKTGQSVGAAASNPQMHFLALCVSRLHGLSEVPVELIYIAEDGSHRVDRAILDSLDLDSFAAQLREAVTLWRSPEAAQRVNPGEHCRYCPCFDSCPAQHQLVRTFARTLDIDSEAIARLSPEAAGRVWEELERFEVMAKKLRAGLSERAHRQPLVKSDGTRIAHVEQERRSIDATVAERVLSERYGPEKAREVLETKTSQAAIQRALRGQRGAFPEVMREIEREGGVKVSRYTKLAELPAQLEGGGE
jgi:hypothetical protein